VNPGVLLLLGRWSLGVQLATVLLLAAFFVALARTVRLQEIRLWTTAWIADAVALFPVFLASFFVLPGALLRLATCVYVAGKTAYALLLISGAQNHLRPGARHLLQPGRLAPAVVIVSIGVGLLLPGRANAQIVTDLIVGAVLTVGALGILRRPRLARSRWLGVCLLVEGLLFLHYVPLLVPRLWGRVPIASYVQYSSFFDAGAELLVALAILVVVESSSSEHLQHLNRELIASQDRLRQLVDLDPLTSLANRRRLRHAFDRVRTSGAAVIFLDMDDFKGINDRYGHIVGDACLLRLAAELTRTFRPDDAVFRLGGDEFLVVAPGLEVAAAHERVGSLRAVLAKGDDGAPPCTLSVGVAQLPPEGEPEAVMREADERMYIDKRRRQGSRRSPSRTFTDAAV
jgi:diguanylate cyclase (GGDEF)-like protein